MTIRGWSAPADSVAGPSGAVELGYWIARDHWNRGFATEAGLALLDIAAGARAGAARGVLLRR